MQAKVEAGANLLKRPDPFAFDLLDEPEAKGQRSPGGANVNESGRQITKKPFLQRGAGKAGGVG